MITLRTRMSQEIVGALIGLIGGLIGLVGGSVITLWVHSSQEKRETAINFREVLEKLIMMRMESARIWAEFQDPNLIHTKEMLSAALNARRLLLKSTAAQMVERINDGLLADDYLTLGAEHQIDSDYLNALGYFQKALSVKNSSLTSQINAHRSIGSLYLSAPPLRNLEQAEHHWQKALSLSANRQDDYSKYTTGYTLEQWGWNLMGANFPGGEDKIEKATETYKSMSFQAGPLRDSAIAALKQRQKITHANTQGQPMPHITQPSLLDTIFGVKR